MADRVVKFAADGEKAIGAHNWTKAASEAKRIRVWCQKHQSECLPDGAKAKLFELIQKLYKFGLQHPQELGAESIGLVEDLLKLPEGKLVTAKAKKLALKWLEDSRGGSEGGQAASDDPLRLWLVMDAVAESHDSTMLELVHEDTGETAEISCSAELGLVEQLEAGEVLRVVTQGAAVVRVEVE